MQTNAAGQVVLKLKTARRDGTTHLVMAPLEFMQRQVEWRLCGSQIRECYVGCGSAAVGRNRSCRKGTTTKGGARPAVFRPPVSFPLRLVVVLNEKLLEVMGDDVTQEQAFAHANDVLTNAVGGISDISEIIHIPGLVNVDFEDVKTVMSEPGKALMGTATAGGPDRATKAADSAVACPLLEGIDLSGARCA